MCQSIIDSEYTGWLMPFTTFTLPCRVQPGDRLLQLIIIKHTISIFEVGEVNNIKSNRGDNGCGSTGR